MRQQRVTSSAILQITASSTPPSSAMEFETVPAVRMKWAPTVLPSNPAQEVIGRRFSVISPCWTHLNYMIFSEWSRCGSESTQCVRTSDQCNGVLDCLNGWDERSTLCVESRIRNTFVGFCKIQLINIFSQHLFVLITWWIFSRWSFRGVAAKRKCSCISWEWLECWVWRVFLFSLPPRHPVVVFARSGSYQHWRSPWHPRVGY